ncbi:MAG: valine--tRNA ligase [Elusimicrobia bacterium]|nr:valine--tRNA ligase [Elusimicrobiota bacterium]
MEISKIYEPKEVEEKWLKYWEKERLFNSEPDKKEPFTIVIPPPNVTGSLHIGHALNNLLQDILIRFKRMNGFNACWVPGTDHGGIATQNIIEKELKKDGKKRDDFSREEFTKIMVDWAQKTSNTILSQLKKMGCSCDWDRTSFTMDEKRSKSVNYAFIELYNKGLIYRDTRFVDWCPRCETALNESEVEQEDEKGKLWYIKYPIQNEPDNYITVATTRPETMLGDTAVAINPNDERYKKFIGKSAILPLVNRIIPIIADEMVDPKFGTGAVKITPAHDSNDDAIAKKHNLIYINAIDKKARITSDIVVDLNRKEIKNNEVADLVGKDRDEARKIIIERLNKNQFLEKEENYTGPKKRCYRCNTMVESFTSEQWFMKMSEMAGHAIESSGKEETKFFPEKWSKPYLLWLENLRDWCISRQIWWGHRIPLWYCLHCAGSNIIEINPEKKGINPSIEIRVNEGESIENIKNGLKKNKYFVANVSKQTKGVYASVTQPGKCSICGKSDFVQDPDVLDTWFSSALWPMSVFGWPDETKELQYYYPTDVLVTGHEILYLWVARMIMMGLEFKNEVPYSDVYIHGIVRDSKGKKMSKSLGNVIDPLTIMDKYGTDALRFALAFQGIPGRDMQISDENFLMARNFANKLWNASRFILMNMETQITDLKNSDYADLELTDKWILIELNLTIKGVTTAIENYNSAEASRLLYEFIWSKYCDWYLEFSKVRLYGKNETKKLIVQEILIEILEKTLKLLHPIMPFITEEIYQSIKKQDKSVMISEYPQAENKVIDLSAQAKMQKVIDIITAIRNIRSAMNIKLSDFVDIVIKASGETKDIISENMQHIISLAKVKEIKITDTTRKPELSASAITGDMEIFVLLEGKIDFEVEKKRLGVQLQKINQELKVYESKISNDNFIKKADPEEVERVKQKMQETLEKKNKIEEIVRDIGGVK